MSPTTFLWSAPEIYAPALALFFIGLARSDLRVLAAVGAFVAAIGAWLFRARESTPAAPAEDALVAPASGRVTHLDCTLPFGYGRVVVANRDPFRDASFVVAPLDGTLTIAAAPEGAPDGAVRFVLDAAPGRIALTVAPRAEYQENRVGRAIARAFPLNAHSGHAVRRGEPIAVVKYGGTVTMEYPLSNVKIQKELGDVVVAGDAADRAALGSIQAVWTGPGVGA
jgi:hypothetical protein